jgi:hypothetical protein
VALAQPPGADGATVQPLTIETAPSGETLPAPPAGASLLLSAPLQAQAGREFAVAVSAPPGIARSVQLELNYDSARLQAVGVPETAMPGRIPLQVSGTAVVRFRAIEGQSGMARISVANVSAIGPSGDSVAISAPAPVEISITP